VTAKSMVVSAPQAAAVLHAVDSVSPYVRARLAQNTRGLHPDDVLAKVQDRLVTELHRFDASRGTLPTFAQHLARWVVAGELTRAVREEQAGLDPHDAVPVNASTLWEPLAVLCRRDEQRRWLHYLTDVLDPSDLDVLVTASLGDASGARMRGRARAQQRVAAVARTIRAAMTIAETVPCSTFARAASCVANFQGARAVLPELGDLGRAGRCCLAAPGTRRGPAAAARAEAARRHAERTGITVRAATDRVQIACRLLRIADAVIRLEHGGN